MDFGANTVWQIVQYAWSVYSNYIELGEQGRDLAADIRSVAEQLESSFSFLRNHNEKLTARLRERLRAATGSCRKTLKVAKKKVHDLKKKWRRTWLAVITSSDIADIATRLQKHRSELQAVNQDIDLLLSGWLAANIGEIVEVVRRLGHADDPVARHMIPTHTPPFTRRLLVQGNYVDTRNPKTGHTALQDACENADSHTLVQLLLQRGADPGVATISSRVNAVHIAAYHDNVDALRLIRNHLCRNPYLAHDDDGGDCRYGGDANLVSPEGRKTVVVKRQTLRENSREVYYYANASKWVALMQSTQMLGQTPLHLAAANGSLKAVSFLVDEMCDVDKRRLVNACDLSGRTPLHVTIEAAKNVVFQKYTDVVIYLLNKAADPNIADATAEALTPLHIAAAQGKESIVSALLGPRLRKKVTVDARDARGCTPLHLAAGRGHQRILEILLAAGADARCRDKLHRKPRALASEGGHKGCKRILKAAEPDGSRPVQRPLSRQRRRHDVPSDALVRHHGGTAKRNRSSGRDSPHSTLSRFFSGTSTIV